MRIIFLLLMLPLFVHAEGLDELRTNPYDNDSTSIPYRPLRLPFSQDSINNPFGAGNP